MAKVDGATSFQSFRLIVLPLITPVILIVLVLRTMEAFKVFDIIWIMTGGGPANATQTIAIYAYQTAFQGYDFGRRRRARVPDRADHHGPGGGLPPAARPDREGVADDDRARARDRAGRIRDRTRRPTRVVGAACGTRLARPSSTARWSSPSLAILAPFAWLLISSVAEPVDLLERPLRVDPGPRHVPALPRPDGREHGRRQRPRLPGRAREQHGHRLDGDGGGDGRGDARRLRLRPAPLPRPQLADPGLHGHVHAAADRPGPAALPDHEQRSTCATRRSP